MTAGRRVNTLTQSWCTPPKYVNAIKSFWNGVIALDPCSNAFSLVGAEVEFTLPETDGLTAKWDYATIYVNPPYGSDRQRGTTIKNWLAKCADANMQYKADVIALIPVATNTSHWKKYIFGVADAICFLADTRLRFYVDGFEHEKGAPMACCLVYWGNDVKKFISHFSQYGATISLTELKEHTNVAEKTSSLPLF